MAGNDATTGNSTFNPDPLAAKVPLWLPMGFTVTGLVSGLLLTLAAAVFWPEFQFIRLQPRLLAIVHLFTLGFGSAITIGVLYQMAPVVLVTKLHSPAVGWISMATFVPGMAIIVAAFYKFSIPGLVIGATVTVLGAALFVYNMWHTWRASPEDSLTRRLMLPSVASFMLALLFGFTIVATWRFGWRLGPRGVDLLSAHVFLGAGGWFTGIIIGVSYRLIAMFRLVHGHDEQFGFTIMRLLYSGVGLGVIGPFIPAATPWFTGAGLLLVSAAIIAYAWDFHKLWGRSMRPPDIWMAQVPWAIGYMLAATLGIVVLFGAGRLGVAISPGAVLAVGTLFALGFVGTMVLGLLHKIVPFLVWYHRYMSKIGAVKVPLMKELVDEGKGRVGFILYHASLVMAIVATAADVTAGARAALMLAAVAFVVLISDLVALLIPKASPQEAMVDVTKG